MRVVWYTSKYFFILSLAEPICLDYSIAAEKQTNANLTPRTDDLYYLFPLDDLDLSEADRCTPICVIQLNVAEWRPCILHDIDSTCLLGWICTMQTLRNIS